MKTRAERKESLWSRSLRISAFFSRLSALRANRKNKRSDSRRKICQERIKESLWDQGLRYHYVQSYGEVRKKGNQIEVILMSRTLNFERPINSNQTSFLSLSSVEHRYLPLHPIFQTNYCFPLSLKNRNSYRQKYGSVNTKMVKARHFLMKKKKRPQNITRKATG